MEQHIKKSLGQYFIQYRYLILSVIAALTVLFGYGVTQKLSVQVILEELIPPRHKYVKLHQEYEKQYGGTSTVIVAVVVDEGDIFNAPTLEKIKRVNDSLLFHRDVRRALVYSMAQRKSKVAKGHAGGTVDVSALMWPEIDTTPLGIKQLKENVLTSDIYKGTMVSKDGKAAIIMADCWPDIDYAKFFTFIQNLKEKEETDNVSIHVAGRPMLLGWIFHFMPKLYVIFAITIAFIVFVVGLIFRNLVGLIIPLFAGGLCAMWGFGLISLVGINFNPLMVVLAVLVGARALSHSVQTTRRYLEELYIAAGNKIKAAQATIDGIFLASLAAIVTDAAGFCVLILARIPMIQQIAILCAFWVISILIIVSVIGPLLCVFMPVPRNLDKYSFAYEGEAGAAGSTQKKGWMDVAASLCLKRSNIAIVAAMIIIGLIAAGFDSKLKVGDTFPGSPILWPDSEYNQDCKVINDKFDDSGTDIISIIVESEEEGAILEPSVVKRMDLYERYISHKHPSFVAGTQSITKIIKTLNKEFHEGDARFFCIPQDKGLITNLFFFYSMSGDPSDFTTIVEARYKHTILRVFLKDHTGETLKKVISSTKEFFDSQPEIPGVEFRYAAGYGGILAATNEEIKTSQAGTLLLVFLTVFIFCGLAYRSGVAAVLLCVPLLVANLVAFAYMVIKNIGLDVNVLPVSAVGIGVGVDYGIYILSRMEEEFKNTGGNWVAMTHTTLNSAGKGVVITAVTVILPILLWPIMADMKFQAEMGLLLSFIMFFDMLGALFFLPAAVILIKPKFIYKHTKVLREKQTVTEKGYEAIAVDTATHAEGIIEHDTAKVIREKIARGENVDAANNEGRTLLIEAMSIYDPTVRNAAVMMLLKGGADVNHKDSGNNTPLHYAVSYGMIDTVKVLVENGADVNKGADIKHTALGNAILRGNIPMIEYLVNSGAAVDAQAVKLAADISGHNNMNTGSLILKLFIEKGVDFDMPDEQGRPVSDYIRLSRIDEHIMKHLNKGS